MKVNAGMEWGNFVLTQGTKWGHYQCGCTARGPEVRTEYQPVEKWAEEAIKEWNDRPISHRALLKKVLACALASTSWSLEMLVGGENINPAEWAELERLLEEE